MARAARSYSLRERVLQDWESAALDWLPGAAPGLRVRYPADESPYCNLIGQSSLRYTNSLLPLCLATVKEGRMRSSSNEKYILGLDLGTNSVGWAALRCASADDDEPVRPIGILGAGSRVFEAGVQGSDQEIQQGRDAPRGQQRR